ncbi:General transcription and DNA repair factor IIH helicase subunit XPB (Ercc3) [Carpediemonas membranifera]|uniref:DNA 3'-5' helicase n=1 Tax=Carpediemonas membranifera TaxID=201153 RepID=A0A8J6AR81_9EUKA|nr:General transcription and DNA repair factor IIH helicase subunit XPB (Ercc3) [Carpediemonas membranifera]|eukprot:KAG9390125.1 General transcription and DNA repair factor IIH helicase subunit XPB (Ercc3) [Carpediemonas membranifera]
MRIESDSSAEESDGSDYIAPDDIMDEFVPHASGLKRKGGLISYKHTTRAEEEVEREVVKYKTGSMKNDAGNRPLWVAPDGRIFLEAFNPIYQIAYDFLIAVAEPVSRPSMIHEYRITTNSIFAASSIGLTIDDITQALMKLSKTEVPAKLMAKIKDIATRFRQLAIVQREGRCLVECQRQELLEELIKLLQNAPTVKGRQRQDLKDIFAKGSGVVIESRDEAEVRAEKVGQTDDVLDIPESDDDDTPVKKRTVYYFEARQQAIDYVKEVAHARFPILEEYEWHRDGVPPIPINLKPNVDLRPYQEKSLSKMFSNGRARSGMIVLPCGAGKTLVGVSALCTLKRPTVILCTSGVAVEQWRSQVNLWAMASGDDDVDSHITRFTSGARLPFSDRMHKGEDIDPVVEALDPAYDIIISTYNMMIDRKGGRSAEADQMMKIIAARRWGMLIMDEVHVVASKEFTKAVRSIGAPCKLGLTATLVREDERIKQLYHLIGPKLYEANWLDLKRHGYIADVRCAEVWCPMTAVFYREYLRARDKAQRKLLYAMNPTKVRVCDHLIRHHEGRGDKILVFSDDLTPLKEYARRLGNKPCIHGSSSKAERMEKLQAFAKDPNSNCLFISRIGDNSIDLPNANVLIQISALYGSRRQEAQRLGRVSRPKVPGGISHAIFYTLVSTDTREKFFSSKRSRFLRDQGYSFKVVTSLADRMMATTDGVLGTVNEQEELLAHLKTLQMETEEDADPDETKMRVHRGVARVTRGQKRGR